MEAIGWCLYDFTGIRLIWEKVIPPVEGSRTRKPSSFMFWLVGIYVALFGVASQRYENRLDQIENRANLIYAQLGTEARPYALSRIPHVQKMTVPHKPDFLRFTTPFISLFGPQEPYPEVVDSLKDALVGNKRALRGLNLSGADIQGADLTQAIIKEAVLDDADLSNSNMTGVNLSGTKLARANLKCARLDNAGLGNTSLAHANLEKASMRGTHTVYSDFTGATLTGLQMEGASFYSTNFTDAKGLSAEQVCKTKRFLKPIGINEALMTQVINICPIVLQGPEE